MKKRKSKLDSDLQEALKPWQRQPDEVKLDVLQSQAEQLLDLIDPDSDPCRRAELLQDVLWRIRLIREAQGNGDINAATNHTVELMKVVDDAGRSFAMAKGGMKSSRKRMGVWLAVDREVQENPGMSAAWLWTHFATKHADEPTNGIKIDHEKFEGVVYYSKRDNRLVQEELVQSVNRSQGTETINRVPWGTFEKYFSQVKKVRR